MTESLLKLSFPIGVPLLSDSRRFPIILNQDNSRRSILFSDSPGTSKINLSIAFQAALSLASEGKRVTFILPASLNEIPDLVHGMPQPNTSNMNRVTFVYPSNREALYKYLSELHLSKNLPTSALILHGLEHFIDSHGPVYPFASTCALLTDTITYIAEKQGSSSLVACCQDRNTSYRSTSHMYFDEVWAVRTQNDLDDGHASNGSPTQSKRNFRLERDNNPSIQVTFSERGHQLVLGDLKQI